MQSIAVSRPKAGRSISLDIYRGMACGMILVYHLPSYNAPLGLGQAAMELFFVLSGYLITKSLLNSIVAHGAWGTIGFSIRRIRRLMPAMVGFVLGGIVLNVTIGEASVQELGWGSVASLTGWYNFFQCFQRPAIIGYGGIWSLSLEEQFYLLSVIIVIVTRFVSIRPIIWIIVLVVCMVLIGGLFRYLALVGIYNPDLSYLSYLPPLRLLAFGLGALVFILEIMDFKVGGKSAIWLALVCLLGIAMLVASVEKYDAYAFAFQWAAVPGLGAIIIFLWPQLDQAISDAKTRVLARSEMLGQGLIVLANGLRILGKASYSIYLWHCLVIAAFVALKWDVLSYAWVAMAVLSLLTGLLSWRFIEQRFYRFN